MNKLLAFQFTKGMNKDCWKTISTYLDYDTLANIRLVSKTFKNMIPIDILRSKVGILIIKKGDNIVYQGPIDPSLIDEKRSKHLLTPPNSFVICPDGTVEEDIDFVFYGKNQVIEEYKENMGNIDDNESHSFELIYNNQKIELFIPIINYCSIQGYKNKYGILTSFYIYHHYGDYNGEDEDWYEDYDY